MFCNQCGQQIADNLSFCPNCGAKIGGNAENAQQAQQTQQTAPQGNAVPPYNGGTTNQQSVSEQVNDAFNKVMDTDDHTAEFDPEQVKMGKAMSILCYIGILVLIPMFAEKENKYVRFHANQGFTLFLLEVAAGIVSAILGLIPIFGVIVSSVISIALLIFMVLGIVNAANDKAKELPLIGKIKFIQ